MRFLPSKPADEPGKAWPAIVIGLFVAFGGILFGYDTGSISGILAMDYFKKEFSTGHTDADGNPDISSGQTSLVVSILSAGTFVGALSSPAFSDTIGRKWALMVSCWVFNLGVIFQAAATSLPLFIVGRFFAGAGVGMVSALIPLYQSETAPKWIRGLVVGAYQLAITLGILLAAVVNNGSKDRNDTGSYRIPVAVQFLWALILITGLLFLPETPRFLVKKGRKDAALRSLSKIRRIPVDDAALRNELDEVIANHQYEMSIGKASYIDCFRGKMAKRQFTGMALQMFQQLTGVNFIFYFGTKFFQNSGVKNEFVIQMITCAVNTVMTFPGILLVDKLGRRSLLLIGAAGMCVSQLIVAICGVLGTDQDSHGNTIVVSYTLQKVSIAFICIFIAFFASTWGPLAWIVCGELFPLKFRARGLSITTATNWLWNWAIAFATPYLVDYGEGNANLQAKIFFIWFGCCFICFGFVWFFIYETKGLTLEEVDAMYEEVSKASHSAHWQPTKTFLSKIGTEQPHDQMLEKAASSDHSTSQPAKV